MRLSKPYEVVEMEVVTAVVAKIVRDGLDGARTEMEHTFRLYAPLRIDDEIPAHGYVCIGLQPGTTICISAQHVTKIVTEKRCVRRETS